MIFSTVEDRRLYLRRVVWFANFYRIRVLAYVLMDNHIHFVLIVPSQTALSKFMQDLQSEHARRMNETYGRTGHLFGERFFSASVDDDVALDVIRYVELNTVRAGMVARAEDFEFSSARAHVLNTWDPVVGEPWSPLTEIVDYRGWLAQLAPAEEEHYEVIRKQTRRGRRIRRDDLFGPGDRAD
ncbi:MAG: transposase [Planctomycetes bacterium]|nr:transposase [Planctomycetota bacterium]